MGHRIIIDYFGTVIKRNPHPTQKYGVLYQHSKNYPYQCQFFTTEELREDFITLKNIDPLLYVEL